MLDSSKRTKKQQLGFQHTWHSLNQLHETITWIFFISLERVLTYSKNFLASFSFTLETSSTISQLPHHFTGLSRMTVEARLSDDGLSKLMLCWLSVALNFV